MCEIAVVDPERTASQDIFQLASTLYEEQGDGVGVLSIKRDEENNKFEYAEYKSASPHWQRLWTFLGRHIDETWRFIVHARAQTAGNVNHQNTHPLRTDCPVCDTKWMVHNGVVRNHQNVRAGLISQGHEFNTKVDSEVIAHKFGSIPSDLENIEDVSPTGLRGSLNYILASDDRLLAHFERKYYVTDDFVVTCRTRKNKEPFKEINGMANNGEWVMVTPDGEVEKAERTRWSGRSNKRTGNRRSGSTGTSRKKYEDYSSHRGRGYGEDEGKTDDEYVSEVYRDLMPHFDKVTAIRVAPGVIKVIEGDPDTDNKREEFIKRRDEPALYSYFATDEHYPGDEWIGVSQLFDGDGNLRSAEEVQRIAEDDAFEKAAEGAIAAGTQQTIMDIVNGEDGDEENFR